MSKSKVAITHDHDIRKGFERALEHLGCLSDLFTNKHVSIKPHDACANPDDTVTCTQADTIKALVGVIKRHNPNKITITGGSSGILGTNHVFELLGINDLISEENIEYFNHNRGPFKRVSLEWGPVKEVVINPHIFSYDTIVSLAQHKSHRKTDISLTMRNIAMAFPAHDYYTHEKTKEESRKSFFSDMHGFIAGMCKRFPVQLAIINGHPAAHQGAVFDSQLIIAGRDFVAVDYVGARVMGISGPVAHIEQAERLGLGHSKPENMEIVGTSIEKAAEIFALRARAA
ncbi:MAG: DUF362 domain-containing protein [Chitinispirillales bacterium]|jgi:uncharacterized protein (DUF362 family)|nr:DUF362 domain-containing protein [Chitinispirillales bacterium]